MATFSNEHAYNPYGAIHPEAHYQGYHGNTNPAQSSGHPPNSDNAQHHHPGASHLQTTETPIGAAQPQTLFQTENGHQVMDRSEVTGEMPSVQMSRTYSGRRRSKNTKKKLKNSNIRDPSSPRSPRAVNGVTFADEQNPTSNVNGNNEDTDVFYPAMDNEDCERNLLQLNERLKTSAQSKRRSSSIHFSSWQKFRYVKWPKIKSRIKSFFNWELWHGHLKYIRSHFGTGVQTYYIFLRWLFLLNLLITILWVSFVFIPQVIWRASPEGQSEYQSASASQRTCAFTSGPLSACGVEIMMNASNITSNVTLTGPPDFCIQPIQVCRDPMEGTTFVSKECSCQDGYLLERGAEIRLSANTTLCTDRITLCQQAREDFNGARYILDFIQGENFFNTTELFIGWYTNSTINGTYDLPLAYLLVGTLIYIISVLSIVIRLGKLFNVTSLQVAVSDISNKIFAGWDYNITNPNSAARRTVAIKRELDEFVNDIKAKHRKRSKIEILKIVVIRFFTNLFVILCLVGAATIIFFTVQAEIQTLNTNLLSPVVIAILNVVLPFIFSFLPNIEMYREKNTGIQMTVFRLLLVKLSSLITLIGVILWQIQCTQPLPEEKGTQCSVDFTLKTFQDRVEEGSEGTCPTCWETVIGQIFWGQALVTFIITIFGSLLVDVAKNIGSRINWPIIGKGKITREFDIPKSILDLIYLQAILWLGFFFCPIIPLLNVINLLLLFYTKRYSMQLNLVPSKEAFRAAKKDFTFQLILLLTALACLLPIGYAIARMVPSSTCSPFRSKQFIYSIVEFRIADLTCSGQAAVGFFLSSGFIVPALLFLLMIIIGLSMAYRARGTTLSLLKRQLTLENEDKAYLYERMITASRRLRTSISEATDGNVNHLTSTLMSMDSLIPLGSTNVPSNWHGSKARFVKMSTSADSASTDL